MIRRIALLFLLACLALLVLGAEDYYKVCGTASPWLLYCVKP